jgi:POT family proton-dependent oligopeptide transporter
MSSVPPVRAPRTLFGHPLGLYVLFFTEMWERFSYYGMRALLVLYMLNYFKWTQKDASTVYKVYTSFVYVTPIIGGYLADRYLGNRRAVIIGAILMAIGHFLMAFEEFPLFLSALGFLILGNGMFKPNMSTQVGRLYPVNDGRLDSAYTIFYMGINLGAFLSPIACGWLAENTVGGYHSGFTMAGIGMLIGLLVYLLGQPLVRELPHGPAAEPVQKLGTPDEAKSPEGERPLSEAEAAATPSMLGALAGLVPKILGGFAVLMLLAAPLLWYVGKVDHWDGLMLGIGGVCMGVVAFISSLVVGGVRDRVLSILVLGVFVMFFWAAYEQAGNVLNVWADKHTNRYLTQPMQPPSVVPDVPDEAPGVEGEVPHVASVWQRFGTMFRLKVDPNKPDQTWGEWLSKSFNPVPTAWFQSINALAIFVIAPLFAWMWIWLDRRGKQPSIPMKMFLGLVLMSASVAVMIQAAKQEDKQSAVPLAGKPPVGINVLDGGVLGYTLDDGKSAVGPTERFHACRLTLANGQLTVMGVLPDNERDLIIEKTAPVSYYNKVAQLAELSKDLEGGKSASIALDAIPPGFDMKFSGLKRSAVSFDRSTLRLTTSVPLKEKETKGLLVAAGEPEFRATVHRLFVESNTFRVSPWWLFWSYILATLGELCLSPVGLSMVSKLSPARFSTMLMGVWMLTSAFGNFAAGLLGEMWGTVPPVTFFLWTSAIVAGAAVVLLVIVRLLRRMMHGVM